ncbi:hypothetical protein FRC09_020314 [Ceratobasidium sp. 395]|nr:hypothetical protein FRC09_020314 [Ceratobasidium sp. 395]
MMLPHSTLLEAKSVLEISLSNGAFREQTPRGESALADEGRFCGNLPVMSVIVRTLQFLAWQDPNGLDLERESISGRIYNATPSITVGAFLTCSRGAIKECCRHISMVCKELLKTKIMKASFWKKQLADITRAFGTSWEDYEKASALIPLHADVVEHVEELVHKVQRSRNHKDPSWEKEVGILLKDHVETQLSIPVSGRKFATKSDRSKDYFKLGTIALQDKDGLAKYETLRTPFFGSRETENDLSDYLRPHSQLPPSVLEHPKRRLPRHLVHLPVVDRKTNLSTIHACFFSRK